MNNNNIESRLDQLSKINKTEAPEFLLTRINRRIQSESGRYFSPRLTRSLIAIFILILLLNITLLVRNSVQSKSEKSIAETMHLMPHNSLYE